MLDRAVLRQQMRLYRQQLSAQTQHNAAEKIGMHICQSGIFYQSEHIAGYIAQAGEIDPYPALQLAWQLNKTCYLPVMQAEKQLCFIKYEQNDPLTPGNFDILEPAIDPEKSLQPQSLDLVLVPLVAFDHNGNRLGMGSGYYDQTFAFLKNIKRPAKPFLMGLAYEWQACDEIISAEWDIKLDAIVTEKTIYLTA